MDQNTIQPWGNIVIYSNFVCFVQNNSWHLPITYWSCIIFERSQRCVAKSTTPTKPLFSFGTAHLACISLATCFMLFCLIFKLKQVQLFSARHLFSIRLRSDSPRCVYISHSDAHVSVSALKCSFYTVLYCSSSWIKHVRLNIKVTVVSLVDTRHPPSQVLRELVQSLHETKRLQLVAFFLPQGH